MIRRFKKVEDLPKTIKILSRTEAFEKLVAAGVTKGTNTQMLNVWVNDQDTQLDAYKVTGGPIETRGLYFREADIDLFITYKTMSFRDFKMLARSKEVDLSAKEKTTQVKGQTTIDELMDEERNPVKYEGKLTIRDDLRYEIEGENWPFTSGEPLEYYNDGRWIPSRIEHGNGDYYIYHLGEEVNIQGQLVRVRER